MSKYLTCDSMNNAFCNNITTAMCQRQTINVYTHSHHTASKYHTSCHNCSLDALWSQKTSYNNLNLLQQQLQDLRYLRVNGYASTYAAFSLSSDSTCAMCDEEIVSKTQILKGSTDVVLTQTI